MKNMWRLCACPSMIAAIRSAATGRSWILSACIVTFLGSANTAEAQNAPPRSDAGKSALDLFRQMVGTWDVQQRMWPASGAAAIDLPGAVARRRLIGNTYLEETMEAASESKDGTFTRNAFFNYNAVNQQYEYFSIDTRAPQMMLERDHGPLIEGARQQMPLVLYGGSFVAPQWGDARNAAFRYRLEVDAVTENRQVVRLYLTPQSEESAKEFLAFEYVYARRR